MNKSRDRGIWQLPDGRWQWSYVDPDGKRHRYKARTKAEARAYVEKARTEIRENRYLDRKQESKTTFSEACKQFLEWSQLNLRAATYNQDVYFVARWKDSTLLKDKLLERITLADVEAYRARLAERVRNTDTPGSDTAKKISKRTIDLEIGRLRRLFSLCQSWGLCSKNPVAGVKFFRPESRRDRFLSEEEELKLVAAADNILRPGLVFALNTGIRRGEMLSLTWGQVNTKAGFITITAEKAKGKRSRQIPMNEAAKAVLQGLPQSIDPKALVFTAYLGRWNSCLRHSWMTAIKAAGVEDICWHTLRHTFATNLAMAGVDLVTIKDLLGHTTLDMVLRYSHPSRRRNAEAVKALDKKWHESGTKVGSAAPSA